MSGMADAAASRGGNAGTRVINGEDAGADRPTVLRALLAERHWGKFEAFEAQFARAARELAEREEDPRLARVTVSQRQFERWRSGMVKSMPLPDSSRILEHMFGIPVRQLLGPADTTANGDIQRRETLQIPECKESESRVVISHDSPVPILGREFHQTYSTPRHLGRKIAETQSGFGFSQGDIKPLLRNMSSASAVPIIAGLREVQRGYLAADQLAGALAVSGAISTQIPIVEKACEVARGSDRSQALDFACRFMEFCGWIYQDAGDLSSAMFWTDRALDYAIELGDQRNISYTFMRKSAIATEAGNPAHGLGIANSAFSNADALTPRLKAVILRQRAHAHAALEEITEAERDADNALAEAEAGVSQDEEDRAPYCSPMYIAMETGQSMVIAGHPENALAILAKSHSEWSDRTQARDYALCASRLATAYATAGKLDEACDTAEEAISLSCGIGSRRVIGQLGTLLGVLGKQQNDPAILPTQRKLSALVGSFRPE